MKKLFIIFIMFTSLSIYGQNIVYVDSKYILENIPEFNTAQEELSKLSIEWEEELDLLKEEIARLYRKYQAEQYLLPEETKRNREEQIIQKEQEIKLITKQRFGPEGELYQKQDQLIRPIQDLIYKAIANFAEEGKYDIIFDKSSDLIMLFSNDELDKSDEVLKKLGY
jgi:outer membrane protein